MEKKLVSHILFLGRNKNNEVRLYMIEVNPWKCDNTIDATKLSVNEVREKDFNFARVFEVESVPAIDFTGIVCSDIKKAEMLVKKSDPDDEEKKFHMSIIIQ